MNARLDEAAGVIRQLGDDRYGQYSVVLAFVGIYQIFAELGVPVTLIEWLPQLLPGEEAEASSLLTQGLKKLGVTIQTFAYPYGLADAAVIRYTIDAGYTSAVGLGSNVTHDQNTLYFLDRKEVKSWYGLDFFEDFMPWTD